jgi:hypothetical protein
MASADLKLIVAREIACGETVAEVARRHGYSWKGMKKLVETPQMGERIQAERQRIQTLGDQCRAQLLQLGPSALDHLGEVLANPRHPKRLDAAKFVVEKILPNRTMLEADVNVGISVRDPEAQKLLDNALVQIARHLEALSAAQAGPRGFMRHVYSGADALPRPRLQAGSPTKVPSGAEGLPELPTEER